MGLLDSLFSGSGDGGILGFLRNNALNQDTNTGGMASDRANYGPPMFAAPSPPIMASGAQPSPLDMAQWPSGPMGAPSQANAQMAPQAPTMMPPQTSPTQPQSLQGATTQPPPAVQAAFMQPPSASGFGGALRGAMANMQGGPLGLIAGALSGGLGMGQGSPQDIMRQNQQAQYQAFIGSGMTPQNAMLAVLNPEAAKTLVNETLSNKEKYGVIKEDPLQGKQYGFINEREQTVNGKPIGAQDADTSAQAGGIQAMTDRITAMREKGASREELLKQIPTGYRDDVEALVTGKAVPANMGRAQVRGSLNILAHAVDKNYDEQMIPARIQMRKDFAGEGKNGMAIGALNTVQHHAGQLSDAIEEFDKAGGGSNWPILNSAKLMLANNTSYDPKLRDAGQKLNDKLNATEHEVASAYNSGHLSDHDLKTWNEIKAANLPADQLRQKLADFDELLAGKRDSLNHIYQQTFHEDAPTIDRKANEETSAKIHSRLRGTSTAAAASSSIAPGWSYKGSR